MLSQNQWQSDNLQILRELDLFQSRLCYMFCKQESLSKFSLLKVGLPAIHFMSRFYRALKATQLTAPVVLTM
jgi:hypothetical protein